MIMCYDIGVIERATVVTVQSYPLFTTQLKIESPSCRYRQKYTYKAGYTQH